MELATMSRLYPGRLLPGIGLGVPLWLEQMGLRPRAPLKALRECLTGVRRLLDGDEVSEVGDCFTFDRVVLTHKPQERLPLYMGLVNERGLRLSGKIADGTILSVLAGTSYIDWARKTLDEAALAANRNGRHRIVTYALYSVDRDPRAAREAVRDAVAFYLEAMPDNALSQIYGIQPQLQELLTAGGAQAVAREMPDEWLEDLAIAGDPDECAAKIRSFLDAGSDAVGLWLFPLDRGREVADLTAREVFGRL
jgi:alkanesulfonate monooxygenase SsuD/methylene tetrahydromethanopterin reductase-like flavin-dependent oxidoreductase (luciferase family)